MDNTLSTHLFHILIGVAGSLLIYHVVFYFIKRGARKNKRLFAELLSQYIYYPGLFFVFITSSWLSLLTLDSSELIYYSTLRHALQIILFSAVAFLLIRTVTVLRELTLHHYTVTEPKDYSYRKAKTKFQLIQRIFNFIVVFTTLAIVLMTFDSIRHIGATLLASAGVLGLVIGFAAQKSLGTLFAGLQIAISQPIRIDDIVVVEEEFGNIEEITLTYVVINTMDGRRLVVPINYFLEKPFENWTRTSPEVISKVKIYMDYTLPVDEIRKELKKWLDETTQWDKRKWGLLVTDATEHTIEVRATMSAKNSDDSFDLECIIREKLIEYIKQNYPTCLPRGRVDIIPEKANNSTSLKSDSRKL